MTFQIVIENDNRMFLGCGPFTAEDETAMLPDYVVAVIDDDATQDWLNTQVQWPPYAHLGADSQSFDLVEEWPAG